MNTLNLTHAIEHDGFAMTSSLLTANEIVALLDTITASADGASTRAAPGVRRREGVYAIRNLFAVVPEIHQLARHPKIRALVEDVLGPTCFAVRGILFDKTPDANWKVVWHQDLSIAVQQRHEVAGYGPWSEKAGVTHVQPPVRILENMLTIRLHLDSCDESNGPLRVLPGSHRGGRLDSDSIAACRAEREEVICTVPAGGALLMRPLLLHASSASVEPRHRRVIHLEYAAGPLDLGLEWQTMV